MHRVVLLKAGRLTLLLITAGLIRSSLGGGIRKISEDEFVVTCKNQKDKCEADAKKYCKSDKFVAIDTSFEVEENLFQKSDECSPAPDLFDASGKPKASGIPIHRNGCGDQKNHWMSLNKLYENDSSFKKDSIDLDRNLKRDSSNSVFKIRYSCDTAYFEKSKKEKDVKEELEKD